MGLEPDMVKILEEVIYRMDDAYMRNEQNKHKLRVAADEREAKRNAGKQKVR